MGKRRSQPFRKGCGAYRAEKAVRPRMWTEETGGYWWNRGLVTGSQRPEPPGSHLEPAFLFLRTCPSEWWLSGFTVILRGRCGSSQQRAVIPQSGGRKARTPQTRQLHGSPRCMCQSGQRWIISTHMLPFKDIKVAAKMYSLILYYLAVW